ncbi:hypothetical protein CEXT_778501 [Caerostris extrusa]|uniref:Uncharacterized protein n=1 Tax=Caerostris extrusa TaxID=172846 RepID=A0AAV4TT12_CAEEX|nr:hypothetical protein CEXT_778501 [Caerostris extrusa]
MDNMLAFEKAGCHPIIWKNPTTTPDDINHQHPTCFVPPANLINNTDFLVSRNQVKVTSPRIIRGPVLSRGLIKKDVQNSCSPPVRPHTYGLSTFPLMVRFDEPINQLEVTVVVKKILSSY